MRSIVKWWASNAVAANLAMLILLVGGFVSFIQIERETIPYIEIPGAQVAVSWPGASPQDVEEQIVVRMEEAFTQVPEVHRIWSEAREGFGVVVVQAKSNVDKDSFLQDIQRKMDGINSLPPAAERPQFRIFSSDNEMIRLAVSGEESVSERTLKRFAEKTRREVAGLDDVPSVELFGVRAEEVSIEISEDALRQYGLTFQEVAGAIRGTSVNSSSGLVRTNTGNMQLRMRKQADSREEFENITVKQLSNGAIIKVSDIAKVDDGFEQVNLLATVNGKRTILVQVMSGPNMDITKMSRNVHDYVDELGGQIPDGISISFWDDQVDMYQGQVDTIMRNFLSGIILVCLTLMLFLRPIIAFWVSVGIATAFAGGLAFLPLANVSLNFVSIFSFLMVIGVIVDDAIIVGEAIHFKTEEGETGIDAAVNGATMVLKPVIFAVLTTMIFFAPWMMVSGEMREFTRAISLVVIFALTFSLVESLLILPAHLAHLKPANPKSRIMKFQKRIADFLGTIAVRIYRPLVIKAIKFKWVTASIFVAVMVLCVSVMVNGFVGTGFFPEDETDQVAINVDLPEGTPYSRTLEVLKQIQIAEKNLEEEIEADGGELIENWYTRSRDNQVLALVKLVPPETRSLSVKDTAERLRELIGDVPDAEAISVSYGNNNNGPSIQYVLNATSFEALNTAGADLMEKLRSYEGVFNVVNDLESAAEEVQFDLKPGAEALGITHAEVARQIRQGFFGEEVQRLSRDGEDVRVYVRYPRTDRESLDFLNSIRVRTGDGRELPLNSVADLRFEKGTNRILRRERQRAIVISAEAPSERVKEIREQLEESYFPQFDKRHPTVTRGNIGASQGENEFMAELLGKLYPIALVLAYVLIAISFRSYFEPILILLAAIPFCYCGMIMGHLIMGKAMSVFSLLGMFAAAGVAVNDNLVLLDYVHRLRDKGMDGAQALVEAGTRRFRPILLTSLTTFVGLLPLLFDRSLQAQSLVPIGISLAFGVLFALFVTLFFVPALYAIGADIRRGLSTTISGIRHPGFADRLAARNA